jgi:hypothetical protein
LAYGAEDGVAFALLGSHVHLFAVLLVDERDGDVLSSGDEAVIGEDPLAIVTKDDVTNVNLLGPAGVPCGGVFARPHGIKEGNDCQRGGHGRSCVLGGAGVGTGDVVEGSEELRCDGFLSVGWRIQVFVSLHEGTDGWS